MPYQANQGQNPSASNSFYVLPSWAQTGGSSRTGYSGFGSSSGSGPAVAGADVSAQGRAAFGAFMAASGAAEKAVGAYYGAKTQQYELNSRASTLEFEGSQSRVDAEMAEIDAQSILAAGRFDKGMRSLNYAQEAGMLKAGTAASGVEIGVGNAAEAEASLELSKRIDMLTVTTNTLQAAGQSRMRGAQLKGRALLNEVSARNMRRSAKLISPGRELAKSLYGSGQQIATSLLMGGA